MSKAPRKPRGVLIAGNWKMNHGVSATRGFFGDISKQPLSGSTQSALKSGAVRAWAFPPMISLQEALVSAKTAGFACEIGAQNVHWEKLARFTGEISGPMLTEIGISRALTGHSERRQYFGETDEARQKRQRDLLEQGFQVVLCVGETRKNAKRIALSKFSPGN